MEKKSAIPIPLKKCVKRGKKLMIWTETKEHAVTPPPFPQCYLVTKEFQTADFKIHQVGNLQCKEPTVLTWCLC